MGNSRPVAAIEVYLHVWPVSLLLLVCLYRLLMGYISTGNLWLSHVQLLVTGTLLALLLYCGCLVADRRFSISISVITGSLAWIAILTMIPRGLWSGYSMLRSAVPIWLLVATGFICVVGFIVRWWMVRRWLAMIKGHGFNWIHGWTDSQPLYARLLAQRVLTNLGYDFVRE